MRHKTVFLFALLMILSSVSEFCHAQFIHTYISSDSLRVGDMFTYTIVFDGEYQSVSYPDEEDFEDDLEFLSRQRYQVTERRDSLVYTLQFFSMEDITIGRREVHLTTAESDTVLYTTPVPLYFKSTLAEEDAEFRPMKPIFDFARNWWPYIILLFFLLIAGYFLYRWYSNRETKEEKEPPRLPDPFVNPLDELKISISELPHVSSLDTKEDYEQYYITLGDAIRYYLKRVYQFQALEMTTREINETLRDELAPSEIINITRKVLNEADLVKFANFQPGTEQAKSVLRKANDFIETATLVNYEQIRYMKYKYEVKHGIINPSKEMVTATKEKKIK